MVGKDFVAAFIALWFFLTRSPVKIITTSADYSQLESVLWGEIRRFIQTAKYPLSHLKGGPLVINHLHLRKMVGTVDPKTSSLKDRHVCGVSYMLGRVAAKGEGLLGHHVADIGDGIPRTLALFDEACHDSLTEVLTEKGWKYFYELTGKERLLSMNPNSRIATYILPTRLYISKRSGPMYLYERRCGNFCVTPSHRMLWKKIRSGCKVPWTNYMLERMDSFKGDNRHIPRCFRWIGRNEEKFSIPNWQGARKTFEEKTVSTKDWLCFLGWYLAEGCLGGFNGAYRSVSIYQKSSKTLNYLADLCRRLGFNPRVYDKVSPSVRIYDSQLADFLIPCGKYSYEKRIPSYVGTYSPELIEVFLQAFKSGDGYDKKGGVDVLYTSSPWLADELQILSYKAGREATICKRYLVGLPAPNGFSRRDGFVISRSRPGLDSHLKIKRKYLEVVDYVGDVYCAYIPPYHTLFTRRNGVCMWSGNSGCEDIAYERCSTWMKRCLVIGNPFKCNNFFYRGCKEGDVLETN